eukprot:CAMPEP_0175222126 /NCGR_PEP_ID=MMETSP0093-20121207/20664_1 /TAXON_ID=311494 /ORGANISM="Alexandrium monilatum, Strain CCMP3105" /LENGTH=55 /DNA_ID=CAMNT_0016515705 /DNA_START=38 /DNA_END=202 /DNA_ORIENTATION=-
MERIPHGSRCGCHHERAQHSALLHSIQGDLEAPHLRAGGAQGAVLEEHPDDRDHG